jgi:predicted O-linked N-acetylglucosamine transferase (SPINDLY family)
VSVPQRPDAGSDGAREPARDRRQTSPQARLAFEEGLRSSDAGDPEGAAKAFREVIALRPDLPQAHFNLARALDRLGRAGDAAAAYERTLALDPGHRKARRRLGDLAWGRGDLEQAHAHYQELVRQDPFDTRAWCNLGAVLDRLGRTAEGAEATRRVIAYDPGVAVAHHNLGNMVRALEGDTAAIPHYRRAVELDPGYVSAWASLGSAYRRLDEDAALECFRRVVAAAPHDLNALVGLLGIHGRRCDFEQSEAVASQIDEALRGGVPEDETWETLGNLVYLSLFSPLRDEHGWRLTRRIGEVLARQVRSLGPLPSPARSVEQPGRRLRVGYLTPNLRDHPVGHVTLSLFERHDRSQFEVHAFSTVRHPDDRSGYAARHRRGVDTVHDLAGYPPRQAAEQIRATGIDILVDLDGYMEGGSPAILAFRPAPVQAFWLGHAGGLGLPFVDYLVADPVVVPPGEERRYREAVAWLPRVYHCADRHPIAPTCPPREAWGLPAEGVVYGAINNPEKIDRKAFECWMEVLRTVPGSVLWLSPFRQRRSTLLASLSDRALRHGVDPARLVLAERVPDKALHLARLAHADLMLDTVTLNASTTALDALWAGVPLLTVRGDRFANRISESMLRAVGLDDLVCPDLAQYRSRAVELGLDPSAREALRARLAANRKICPLFDSGRFVRQLERLYQAMWARWLRGEPPAAIEVDDDLA